MSNKSNGGAPTPMIPSGDVQCAGDFGGVDLMVGKNPKVRINPPLARFLSLRIPRCGG